MTTLLLQYIIHNDIQDIKRILDNDPDKINDTDGMNISALMYAVSNYTKTNKKEIITYLLEKGANPNHKNDAGVTALHYAMGNREYTNIIKLLLYYDADVYAVNNMNDTIEDYARLWRNTQGLTIIQKHKEDKKTLKIFQGISESNHILANILEMLPMCIESYLLHSQPPYPTINLQKEYKKRNYNKSLESSVKE
jgi:ankyrin repeat protein